MVIICHFVMADPKSKDLVRKLWKQKPGGINWSSNHSFYIHQSMWITRVPLPGRPKRFWQNFFCWSPHPHLHLLCQNPPISYPRTATWSEHHCYNPLCGMSESCQNPLGCLHTGALQVCHGVVVVLQMGGCPIVIMR